MREPSDGKKRAERGGGTVHGQRMGRNECPDPKISKLFKSTGHELREETCVKTAHGYELLFVAFGYEPLRPELVRSFQTTSWA